MSYNVYFQSVSTLSTAKKQQLADIYFQYYAGSDITRFMSDLDNKDEVLILEYQQQLVGFSSVQFYPFQGAIIVYSGDTIVMPAHWQQQVLHNAWIQRMGLLKQQYPDQTLYWFLLVKGYRTYKYLMVFAKNYYPNWQAEQPELQTFAEQLAIAKFGSLYNKTLGVVECPSTFGYLSSELATISDTVKTKPSARFFLSKNPHYYLGHELVCLCEISQQNLPARFQPLFINPTIEFRHE